MNITFKESLQENLDMVEVNIDAESDLADITTRFGKRRGVPATLSLQAVIKLQAMLARAERRLRENGATL